VLKNYNLLSMVRSLENFLQSSKSKSFDNASACEVDEAILNFNEAKKLFTIASSSMIYIMC
jgi:hypothetical protein